MDENTKVEVRRQAQSLGQRIHDLTWRGKFWGRDGAIALDKARAGFLKAIGDEVQALSALSSTYYAAAGNAFTHIGFSPADWNPDWLIAGLWCLMRALWFSERLIRRVGMHGMSADQLDIRATILRKVRRRREALRCINEALGRPRVSAEARALLEVGRGEILSHFKRLPEAVQAYRQALELIPEIRVQSQVRVLKSLGLHEMDERNPDQARHYLGRALCLAKENDLGDQVVKITELLTRIPPAGGRW